MPRLLPLDEPQVKHRDVAVCITSAQRSVNRVNTYVKSWRHLICRMSPPSAEWRNCTIRETQSLLELSEQWDWKWGTAWGLGEIVSPASSPHASCVGRMAPTHPGTLWSSTKWLILLSTLQIEMISYMGFASNVFLLNKRQTPLLICLEVNLKNEVKYKSK